MAITGALATSAECLVNPAFGGGFSSGCKEPVAPPTSLGGGYYKVYFGCDDGKPVFGISQSADGGVTFGGPSGSFYRAYVESLSQIPTPSCQSKLFNGFNYGLLNATIQQVHAVLYYLAAWRFTGKPNKFGNGLTPSNDTYTDMIYAVAGGTITPMEVYKPVVANVTFFSNYYTNGSQPYSTTYHNVYAHLDICVFP